MIYFLYLMTSWRTFWHSDVLFSYDVRFDHIVFSIIFDVMTYFLTSWRTFFTYFSQYWCHDVFCYKCFDILVDFMTHSIDLWYHDILLYIMFGGGCSSLGGRGGGVTCWTSDHPLNYSCICFINLTSLSAALAWTKHYCAQRRHEHIIFIWLNVWHCCVLLNIMT